MRSVDDIRKFSRRMEKYIFNVCETGIDLKRSRALVGDRVTLADARRRANTIEELYKIVGNTAGERRRAQDFAGCIAEGWQRLSLELRACSERLPTPCQTFRSFWPNLHEAEAAAALVQRDIAKPALGHDTVQLLLATAIPMHPNTQTPHTAAGHAEVTDKHFSTCPPGWFIVRVEVVWNTSACNADLDMATVDTFVPTYEDMTFRAASSNQSGSSVKSDRDARERLAEQQQQQQQQWLDSVLAEARGCNGPNCPCAALAATSSAAITAALALASTDAAAAELSSSRSQLHQRALASRRGLCEVLTGLVSQHHGDGNDADTSRIACQNALAAFIDHLTALPPSQAGEVLRNWKAPDKCAACGVLPSAGSCRTNAGQQRGGGNGRGNRGTTGRRADAQQPPSGRNATDSPRDSGGGDGDGRSDACGRLQQCSSCLMVNYCGRDCQRRHWAEHKRVCSLAWEVYMLCSAIARSDHTEAPKQLTATLDERRVWAALDLARQMA